MSQSSSASSRARELRSLTVSCFQCLKQVKISSIGDHQCTYDPSSDSDPSFDCTTSPEAVWLAARPAPSPSFSTLLDCEEASDAGTCSTPQDSTKVVSSYPGTTNTHELLQEASSVNQVISPPHQASVSTDSLGMLDIQLPCPESTFDELAPWTSKQLQSSAMSNAFNASQFDVWSSGLQSNDAYMYHRRRPLTTVEEYPGSALPTVRLPALSEAAEARDTALDQESSQGSWQLDASLRTLHSTKAPVRGALRTGSIRGGRQPSNATNSRRRKVLNPLVMESGVQDGPRKEVAPPQRPSRPEESLPDELLHSMQRARLSPVAPAWKF